MKTFFNKITLPAIVFILLSYTFTSCDDDNNTNDATPIIRYIRVVDAEKSDSLLTSASLGSTIAIIGENFSNIKQIWFNDQSAKLNPMYITNTTILVTVPSQIPEEVTDQIRLITAQGKEITHNFEVTVPAPVLTSLKCEYVADGDIAIIYGDYFIEPKVYFPGNMAAKIVEFTKTELQVIVPENATGGRITVESLYGSTRSLFTFRDNNMLTPTTTIFTDFEDTSWNNWNRGAFASENGVMGQYLKIQGSTGAWAWPADGLQLYFNNPTRKPIISDGEIDDLALRFEFYSHEWHDTPLMMWFSNKSEVHNVDGDEPQAHWKPYLQNGVKSNYVTDGWITVTIPLRDFKHNKEETEARSITSVNELVDFHIIIFGPADEVSNINIWMDNFRIVKL